MDNNEEKNNINKDTSEVLSKASKKRTNTVSATLGVADAINKYYAKKKFEKKISNLKTQVEEALKESGDDNNSKQTEKIKEIGIDLNKTKNSYAYVKKLENDLHVANNELKSQKEATTNDEIKEKKPSSKTIQTILHNEVDETIDDFENINSVNGASEKDKKFSNIQTIIRNDESSENTEGFEVTEIEEDKENEKDKNKEKNKKKNKSTILERRGVFTRQQGKGSRALTVGLKTTNKLNRGLNKAYAKGKKIQSLTSGEISTTKESLTGVKNVAKKSVTKPINFATKPIKRKVKHAMAQTGIKSAKVVTKMTVSAVKATASIILKLLIALLGSLPVVAMIGAIVAAVVSVVGFFGGGSDAESNQKFQNYMLAVQDEYNKQVEQFKKDGFEIEGLFEEKAYVNWEATMSVIWGIAPDSKDWDEDSENLLNKWKDAGLFFKVKEVEYTVTEETEVEVEEEKTDENGNKVKEKKKKKQTKEVKKKKKVLSTSGVDDYIKWCNNNPDALTEFFKGKFWFHSTYRNNRTFDKMNKEETDSINKFYNQAQNGSWQDIFILVEQPSSDIVIGGGTGELHYPTNSAQISAGFPNYSDGSPHGGIDFPVGVGTDVYAAEDGTVIESTDITSHENCSCKYTQEGYHSYGKYIMIQHDNGLVTLYAHNSERLVKKGDKVVRGQIIAKSGNTGNSSGPHCHFEVRKNGTKVNPLDYLDM